MAAVALTAVLAAAALPQQIPAAEKTVGGLTAFVHEIEPSGTEPRLNKSRLKLMEGDTAKLKVRNYGEKVKWISENPGIATVDKKGWVLATGEGATRIRAKAGKRKLFCIVKVWAPSITIDKPNVTLIVGEEAVLTTETNPAGSYTSWESDNVKVATVENGVVKAHSVGTATISAKMRNASASCIVTVTDEAVALSESTLEMIPGEIRVLKVTTVPDYAAVSWSSSNSSVATVESGTVYAIAEGTALIMASTENGFAVCEVKVRKD